MYNKRTLDIISTAEKKSADSFLRIEEIAFHNQEKVLNSFRDCRVSSSHFAGTSGYGYGDIGRDTLAKLFAKVFKAESAVVSPLITGGTQALTVAMFAVLRPNDYLLSATGTPYDTLSEVINGKNNGSLRDFGIKYDEVSLIDGRIDLDSIMQKLRENKNIKLVLFQRSRGYSWRRALSVSEINTAISEIKRLNPNVYTMVDNCYGEFTEKNEPSADMVVGSLIKNAGGGMATGGGYIVGTDECVELTAKRLTAPSLGNEVGSYPSGYLPFYQGLFLAPHTVSQALKGAVLLGNVFMQNNIELSPLPNDVRSDIIQAIRFKSKESLIEFCRTVQYASPVDSFLTCEPWDMPGYDSQVIMAAGAFVSGASIELSCDAPIKPPYTAYIQGGLTYEHVKCASAMLIEKLNLG